LENMRACWFARKTGAAVRASAWREARAKMGVAARRTDIARKRARFGTEQCLDVDWRPKIPFASFSLEFIP